MLYYSTNLQAQPVTFREALLKGLAPDRGLFMPRELPIISAAELRRFSDLDYTDIAFEVTRKFLREEIAEADLRAIAKDAYTFPIPLEHVYARKYVMRLDHGPTASFKDFAARMMGRLMQYFLRQADRNLLILVATSGDTGSAIANAFYGLENIKVVVLYPEREVTERQRKQMTTLAKNIQIIAIEGKFDDCQALVKRAFADPELASLPLSSANSINIGRLLPQIIYYVYAYAKLRHAAEDEQIIFSVPSGNFGNLMGGLLAKHIGLPVKKFVVATNENDEFPVFLTTGDYEKIAPSRNCISSAMNVGHPSNVARLIALYGGNMDETGQIHQEPDFDRLCKDMYSVSISDAETQETIKQAYTDHHLLLEPHGAVAWAGLLRYFAATPHEAAANQLCVAIETAHPAKFPEKIQQILGFDPELPPSLEGLEGKPEFFVTLPNSYTAFREFLQEQD